RGSNPVRDVLCYQPLPAILVLAFLSSVTMDVENGIQPPLPHVGHKTVAALRRRLDISLPVFSIAQCLAHLRDVGGQVGILYKGVGQTFSALLFPACAHSLRPRKQQVEGFGCERHSLTITQHRVLSRTQEERAEYVDVP